MKLSKIKYSMILPLLGTIVLGGCLKDKDFDDLKVQAVHSPNDGQEKVVSVGLTVNTTDNHLQLAFDNSNSDTTFNAVPFNLGGEPASQDIQFKVVLNDAVIGNYNAEHGTAHEAAPSNVFSFTNPGDSASGYVVTIPKGSNTGWLVMKLKPVDFLGHDYAIGVQISSIQQGFLIASNLSTGVLAIGVKNQWDGVYSYRGYALRAGDAALTGSFTGKEMPLKTAGISSLQFSSAALWGDGNSGIAIGNPQLDFTPSSAAQWPVTISSPGGAYNLPGYNSRYEPATKTFYIGFTWGAGPAARQSIDTLTYLRPR